MPRINKEFYPQTKAYKDAASEIKDDKNSCAIIAMSIAFNRKPTVIQKMAEKEGRKKGNGTPISITRKIGQELGFRLTKLKPEDFISKYPEVHKRALKHVSSHHPDRFPQVWQDGKTYLFRTNHHIFCVKDGVAQDWMRGRRFQVKEIYVVTKVK